jgi:hypothetical protein
LAVEGKATYRKKDLKLKLLLELVVVKYNHPYLPVKLLEELNRARAKGGLR